MPILDTELIWRPSKMVSDTTAAQNGGAINFTKSIVSGVKNNLFPDVSQTERLAGSTRYRKAFIHANSVGLIALQNARVFLDAMSPGQDFFLLYSGAFLDTQDQITSRPYGVASLRAATSVGAVSVSLLAEDFPKYADLTPFRVGDTVRIADRPAVGGSGGEEFAMLSEVTYLADRINLKFSAGLANAYPLIGTVVSSVFLAPDCVAAYDSVVKTSVAGTLVIPDHIIPYNRGSIEQQWTLTFTSATLYSVTGDTVSGGAAIGTGSVTTDFSATNPDTGAAYFTLRAALFHGTFAAGDTVVFKTHPAAIPVWYRREIPANTASLSNDYASLAIQGESA